MDKKKIIDSLRSIRDILLWFIRDHNGKPSSTRLVILIITYKSLEWGDHIVYQTQTIPQNLVILLSICIVGVAFFMRLLSQNKFIEGMTNIVSKVGDPTKNLALGSKWWTGGVVKPPKETEEELEKSMEGPKQAFSRTPDPIGPGKPPPKGDTHHV